MTVRRDLKRAGLSFFGDVTAGITHDIRNSLAILKEISGLLSDLGDAAGEGGALDAGRVKNIAARLDAQVNRANATVGLLNRFAHSVDVPRRRIDLPETVAMVGDLAKSKAVRKRVSLEVVLPEHGLAVEGDPFLLEHVIFLLLGMTIESAEVGGAVTLALSPAGPGAIIRFEGAGRGGGRMEGVVSHLLMLTGCTAEYEGRGNTLVLELPGRMPGEESTDHG